MAEAPEALRDARSGAAWRNGGRAIGQAPGDRHAVVYRFVLPVKVRMKDKG